MAKTISRPGPRLIYPDLVSSRSLSRCGLLANALWPRLIVQADDQGRLPGDPGSVTVACFPKLLHEVKIEQVEAALGELKKAGMVLIYRAGGETYLQIADWWRWQQGMRRAYGSRFPAPRGWIDVTFGSDGEPTTFAKAVEYAGIVLSGGSRPTAARGQSAGRVRAASGQSADPARAQDSAPPRSATTRPVTPRSNPSAAAGAPPGSGERSTTTNGTAAPADPVEVNAELLRDRTAAPEVRAAARKTLRRHAPGLLEQIEAELEEVDFSEPARAAAAGHGASK